MSLSDSELFFLSPRTAIKSPNWFGVLYLLRRDIDLCIGIQPDTWEDVSSRCRVLWPGAVAILAGVDLLAKFFAGSDERGEVSNRFRRFLECCFQLQKPEDRDVIYQLRNSLLHSFGLYSQDKGRVYRFFLTGTGTGPLISQRPGDKYFVDVVVLRHEFEKAVERYQSKLDADAELQKNFGKMFANYGRIYIG